MKSLLFAVGRWFDRRLSLRDAVVPLMEHPVPPQLEGPVGWWYIFGSASLTLLIVQILTGIGLSLVFVPSADRAYESLLFLNYEHPLGWFLRALHYYAGSGMVVMVLVHMTQVFLHGAFKYPRELTWITGAMLLLCTLGMFFTGQVLRWDPDAYWGLAVGASMAGRVPVAGPQVVHLLLGGPVIGGAALSRFFALHVFIIPGTLLLLLGVHLWLVVKRGVSVPPRPGQLVNPKTYDAEYEKVLENGVPFFGEAMMKDAIFSALAVVDRGDHRGRRRSERPVRAARPDDEWGKSAARMALSVAVRPVVLEPGRRRDLHHAGLSRAVDHRTVSGPVYFQPRGAAHRPGGPWPC